MASCLKLWFTQCLKYHSWRYILFSLAELLQHQILENFLVFLNFRLEWSSQCEFTLSWGSTYPKLLVSQFPFLKFSGPESITLIFIYFGFAILGKNALQNIFIITYSAIRQIHSKIHLFMNVQCPFGTTSDAECSPI